MQRNKKRERRRRSMVSRVGCKGTEREREREKKKKKKKKRRKKHGSNGKRVV